MTRSASSRLSVRRRNWWHPHDKPSPFISVDAVKTLWHQERPQSSVVGIVVTGLSLGVMWWLARAKRQVARQLNSRAMLTDAFPTTACWWLSLMALVGLALNLVFGGWWAYPVAALAITGFLVRQASNESEPGDGPRPGGREGAHLLEDDLKSRSLIVTSVGALVREGTPMLKVVHDTEGSNENAPGRLAQVRPARREGPARRDLQRRGPRRPARVLRLPRRALDPSTHDQPDRVDVRDRATADQSHQGPRFKGRRRRDGLQAHRVRTSPLACRERGPTVASAVREGSHGQDQLENGHMEKWTDGDRGPTWHDSNIDNVITNVTFYSVCRHNFDARIRKERFGPDGTVGSERINCTSYDDAVYAGDVPADDYHFDVSEYSCSVAACFYPYLTGDYTEYW